MAICDICKQVMPGTHPSQRFLPGTPMPPDWKIAGHEEVVHSRDLIKAALLVHLQPLGINSEQITITDDDMKKWVEEMESRFGQTAWMLCPTCNGILDPSVQVQKPVAMSMQGPPAMKQPYIQTRILPISRLQAIIVAFHNFPSEIPSDDQGTNLALTYFKSANPNPEFMRLMQKLPPGNEFNVCSLNVSGCSVDEFPVNAMRAVVKDFPKSSLFAQGFRRTDPYLIDTFVFTIFEPRAAEESRRTVITDGSSIIPAWQ